MQSSRATEQQQRAQPAEEGERPAEPAGDELAELRERNAQLDDRYKRALADLDNYRKRSGRDADQRVADAREAVLRDWLDAVDSVERAMEMAGPANPAFEGLRAVLDQMEAILDRYGVSRVGAPGDAFDPERHEAVAVRETDEVPAGSIAEVARSGYAIGDRLLRPAQVVVSRAPRGAT